MTDATTLRVVRLQPWSVEVVQQRDDRPWDEAVSLRAKRRDAEQHAAALRAQAAMMEAQS